MYNAGSITNAFCQPCMPACLAQANLEMKQQLKKSQSQETLGDVSTVAETPPNRIRPRRTTPSPSTRTVKKEQKENKPPEKANQNASSTEELEGSGVAEGEPEELSEAPI